MCTNPHLGYCPSVLRDIRTEGGPGHVTKQGKMLGETKFFKFWHPKKITKTKFKNVGNNVQF